jgi:hypothetical protein
MGEVVVGNLQQDCTMGLGFEMRAGGGAPMVHLGVGLRVSS